MQKVYKNIYCLFYLLLLLPVSPMYGQTDILKEITRKFQNYCREMPREEVFVHTDRSEYIAGEEVWFSAWLFDRQSGKPEEATSILYVEILNSENRTIGHKRIETYNGSGNGEILLPDTLGTGCYTLRAYTSWMKNFLPFNCYTRQIGVFNSTGNGDYISCKVEKEQPEQRTVSSKPGSYKSSPFFTVNIENNKGDNIDFSIEAADEFRSANNSSCYIFIETHGVIEHSGIVRLTALKSLYSVPIRSLTRGVSHVTFFTTSGVPAAERYIYIPGKTEPVLAITLPDSCKKREKIHAEISIKGNISQSVDSAKISISVIPKTSTGDDLIDNYMVFGSEFGSLPVNIAGKNPDEIPSYLLDSFLTTARSNWIDWNIILSGRYPSAREPQEKESHFLLGRLINRNTHQPVINKILILSIPGRNATFQYYVTDKNGLFRFAVPISENEEDLIIQPWENEKGNAVEILSSFDEKSPADITGSFRMDKNIPDHIARWSTNYQVNRIYGIDYSKVSEKKASPPPERTRFYGKPDIELKLDDYIKLPVMQEIFFELLPGIKLKSHNSVYEISMIDPVTKTWQKNSPVLFIDGVMINDATAIAGLDPEMVERIDVITGKYNVGNLIFYGLINVITRAADFTCTTLPDQAVRIKYSAIDREASFKEPEFSDPDLGMNNIPDFRNTLYWNPSVSTGKNGKCDISFRASDLEGEYEITVQGIAADGKPVSGRKVIKIY
jgi:hypothetical protein